MRKLSLLLCTVFAMLSFGNVNAQTLMPHQTLLKLSKYQDNYVAWKKWQVGVRDSVKIMFTDKKVEVPQVSLSDPTRPNRPPVEADFKKAFESFEDAIDKAFEKNANGTFKKNAQERDAALIKAEVDLAKAVVKCDGGFLFF